MVTDPRQPKSKVFYWHSIDDKPGSLSPKEFRTQLECIIQSGLAPVTLRDLLESTQAGETRGRFAVTFDDGYADNLDHAGPVLLEMAIPATVFIVTDLISDRRQNSNSGNRLYPGREMMSTDDVRRLAEFGITVGSHSHFHRLASAEVRANPSQFRASLLRSRETLTELVQYEVLDFAYPNGQRGAFSKESVKAVRDAGFRYGFTTIWGSMSNLRDFGVVPRCEARHDYSPQRVHNIARGRHDYRRLIQLTRRGAKRW